MAREVEKKSLSIALSGTYFFEIFLTDLYYCII